MSRWSRGVGAAVAGALCATAAVMPVRAADPIAATLTSVCTVTQLQVQTTQPVSLTTTVPTSFGVTASGTCTGTAGGPFMLTGVGDTVGPADCAVLLSIDGQGTVSIGGPSHSVNFVIAGTTAAPVLVFAMTQASLGNVVGTAALILSPASLEACLQGGTTILQYSGIAVFAL